LVRKINSIQPSKENKLALLTKEKENKFGTTNKGEGK
jgi:hypothetical protein